MASTNSAPVTDLPSRGTLPANLTHQLERSHLPSLDGLRAFAAFLVVFWHGGVTWSSGSQGVLAFFVLSGFLITWLLLKEDERYGRISIKSFYIRRSLRIFPAFYVFASILIASDLLKHRAVSLPETFSALFYVINYYQAIRGTSSMHFTNAWSLAVEEQFYLLWPLVFLLLRDNRRRVRFLVPAILIIWAYRGIGICVLKWTDAYVYQAFDTRADHLLIGCLLAVSLREGYFASFWAWICARPALSWVTIALLMASNAATLGFPLLYSRDLIGFMAEPLLVAILLTQTIAAPGVGFGYVLNLPWLRYLGTISYSLYLYHPLAGILKRQSQAPQAWIAYLAGAIILASGSYWLVETPFLKLKDRFARSR